MKSYCNNLILAERHTRMGRKTADAFLKSIKNNPMKTFSATCFLLTGRKMDSTEIGGNLILINAKLPVKKILLDGITLQYCFYSQPELKSPTAHGKFSFVVVLHFSLLFLS